MTSKEQVEEMFALMRATIQKTQHNFFTEAAEIWKQHGPERARKMLDRIYSARKAKRDADFQAYTTYPCGCYRDPGGHP